MEIATCSLSLLSVHDAEMDGNIHPGFMETPENKLMISPTSYKIDQECIEPVISVSEKNWRSKRFEAV